MRPILLCSNDKGMAQELQRAVNAMRGGPTTEIPVAVTATEGLQRACELDDPAVVVDARLEAATDLLRAMKTEAPKATRTAASNSWVEPLRYAMQAAGAEELLDSPFDPEAVRSLLGASPLPRATPRKGRLLCFISAQSGNGASTIGLHLGQILAAQKDRKALLVELDFHSGALACRMGLEPKSTLADLSGLAEEEALRRWRGAVQSWKGLDVLLGPPSSNVLSSRGLPPVELVLDAALQTYDDVLADLPCSMNASVRGVVAQAEQVYLTATSEISSLHLASRRFQELRSAGVPESKIFLVLNRVGEGGILDEEDVIRIVGVGVKYRLRNDYRAASTAESKGELTSPESALGRGLTEIGEDLLGGKRSASHLVQKSLQWFFNGGKRA